MAQPVKTQTEHPDVLLPWYVNNTLSGDERHEVEAHLAGCERCRDELAWLRAVQGSARAAQGSGAGELGLQRLLRNVRAQKPARRWWRPALATAAVLVIVLQSAAILQLRHPNPAVLTPLGAAAPAGAVLQVRFRDDAREGQVRALLNDLGATVIGGPGALGVYRIRVPAGGDADAAMQRALAKLQASPEVAYAARN
jgi:anti-sigma factor RsiW